MSYYRLLQLQDFSGLYAQDLPYRGQDNLTTVSFKKLRSDRFFKFGYILTDCRLGYLQFSGSPCKTAFPG